MENHGWNCLHNKQATATMRNEKGAQPEKILVWGGYDMTMMSLVRDSLSWLKQQVPKQGKPRRRRLTISPSSPHRYLNILRPLKVRRKR